MPNPFTPKKAPTPTEAITPSVVEELVKRAAAQPKSESGRGRTSADYSMVMPAVKALRDKGYSQKAIMAWLDENGVTVPTVKVQRMCREIDAGLVATPVS